MGWFTKRDNKANINKMPELPELPNSQNVNLPTPSPPSNLSAVTTTKSQPSPILLQYSPTPASPPVVPIPPASAPPSAPPSPPPLTTPIADDNPIIDNTKPSPLHAMPEKVTRDLSDENYKPQNYEPKPGMQKSKFSYEYHPIENHPIEYQPIEYPKEYSKEVTPITPSFTPKKFKEPLYQPPSSQSPPIKSNMKKDESIFIKLDKFQNTIEAFRDINEKIREIEDLLTKTKEIKSREERELEEWEREIEAIKLKLETVGREITGSE